jgi:kelch-like protein 20
MKKNLFLSAIILCTVCMAYGQWTYTNLSEPKNAVAYGVLGDSLVMAGGFGTSGSLSEVEVYDPVSGQGFVTGSNLSVARGNVTGVVCGGKFFCAGGGVFLQTPLTTVDIFDAQTQQWTVEQLSQGRFMLSAISYGSKVFFAGGFVDFYLNGSDVVDIYDLQTQTWSTANLSEPRGGMAAAVLGDLAIFAGGMIDQFTFSERVDIYNFTTNTWSTTALSAARAFPEIAAVGNKVLIAGGITAMGVPSYIVDIYDISNNSWSTASLFMPRCLIKAATLNDKVYFAGGATFNFGWSNYSNIIDIYNEEDESWSIDVMPVNCLNPAIAAIGNYLVIAGGENENGVMDLVQVFYDPQTGINQQKNKEALINIYPNPAKDKITIDFPEPEGGTSAQVSIYGSAGQEMIKGKINNSKSEIDVTSLATGLYFIKVENNQNISFIKFIKN